MKINKYISVLIFFSAAAAAKLSGSLTEEAITERLKPEGQVKVSGKVVSKSSTNKNTPVKIYKKYCAVCHDSGFAGSPKIKSKSDWASRVGQGLETLTDHAYNGYNAMPAKGNCQSCSPEDIKNTVQYMLDTLK